MRRVIERCRRDPGLALLAVAVLAAAIAYAPSLGYHLVNYDDPVLVRDNWIVQNPSWHSVHTIFFDLTSADRTTLTPEYLPIRDLSVMLDFAVWGHWFSGFHITNLALYLTAIVLWFAVLDGFGIDRKVAGLAVLLWALHPSHAESVAWIAERKGLLGAMFAGLSGLAYARFRAGRSARWLGLAMLAAVCAVWSKAPAGFAIAALAGLELALPERRQSWRRSVVGLSAIGVVGALAFVPVFLLASSQSIVGTDVFGGFDRASIVLGVHGFYIRSALMTVRNAISYGITSDGPGVLDIVLGAGVLAIAAAVALVPRRGWWAPPPALRAAAVLWLFGWLPIGHLILPLQMVLVADRYLLLPTLGTALALAVGIARIASIRARNALVIVLVLAAAVRTFDAQSNWGDDRTLWQRAVQSNPADDKAWTLWADSLVAAGDDQRAAEVVSAGLTHGRSPRLVFREALIVLDHGTRERALELFLESAQGGEPRAMARLALIDLEAGNLEEATTWARRCVADSPDYQLGLRVLGQIEAAGNHPEAAVAAFTHAYDLQPREPSNQLNLAIALIAVGRTAEARLLLEAVVSDPVLGPRAREKLQQLSTPSP